MASVWVLGLKLVIVKETSLCRPKAGSWEWVVHKATGFLTCDMRTRTFWPSVQGNLMWALTPSAPHWPTVVPQRKMEMILGSTKFANNLRTWNRLGWGSLEKRIPGEDRNLHGHTPALSPLQGLVQKAGWHNPGWGTVHVRQLCLLASSHAGALDLWPNNTPCVLQNAEASYDFSSNDPYPYPRYTDDWFNR